MKLMAVEEFIENYYSPKSRPNKRTLINLIRNGDIIGRKQGKFYYVDVDAEKSSIGNPLVEHVLR